MKSPRKKQFFFEKKNQKTFDYEGVAAGSTRMPMNKSFWFFFQKELLSSVSPPKS
jgi:hypothetical protein